MIGHDDDGVVIERTWLESESKRIAQDIEDISQNLEALAAFRHKSVEEGYTHPHQKARFRGLISGSLTYLHHSLAFTFFGLRGLCSDFFFKPSEAIWLEFSPYWARTSFLETPILPWSSREESLRSSRMASRAT